MCTGPTAGLATRLAARLAASSTARAVGVVDYARVPQAVLIVLVYTIYQYINVLTYLVIL